MVSSMTIGAMAFSIVFSIVLFVGLIVFYKRKVGIYVKPLIIGTIGFLVVTQVLEKALHFVVFTNFPNFPGHPWLFGLYGGLAAGVFEELGRFVLFTWLLKKYLDYKGGISFGIGWGGIEAVALTLMMMVPNLMFAVMINQGTFESSLGGGIPGEQLAMIKETLLNQGSSYYLLASVERFFAAFMQIALSLLVLLGVVRRRFAYVIYAILIHAVIDYPVAFYQTGHIKSLWIIELYLAVIGLGSMWFIRRMREVLE
ncbi:YhfC family intramembrane metalloprotease [Ammoniphilus resinae]|uniref:Membrane protein YhfC n=1 Tax=Ammoniphilus resinae TaxID=861532 RepID=A0ABS4GPN6_9BACL|nr:YhfC family glutamic-type intramembrane protease [Ammoniphilus resinae]MBP1932191.1 putative membrane protein YhfC [Ammoniphilus resinae]